ncbi:MAG: DJ-1/PfpI family protein [Aquificaceae bacterium]|nr:DJ-1/PfpI family protein [Aquificaceae bacterium]MDW8237731.1 DJ-1/PfpI family protein [Aquificaceae bacterium]
MEKVAIILADGYEEIEAVAPIDILRRAGVEVLIAGLSKEPVASARNLKIVPDVSIDELNPDELKMVIIPGGSGGVERIKSDQRAKELLEKMEKRGAYIGAICAGPTALESFKLTEGKRITLYPALIDEIKSATVIKEEKVVEDGNIITSQGPGTALEFSLKLAEKLVGKEVASQVAQKMLIEL